MNCLDYYAGGDKPYIMSGADDRLIKIWDYLVNKSLFILLRARCSSVVRAISRSSQCSTTGVTKAVVCVILSVGWCI